VSEPHLNILAPEEWSQIKEYFDRCAELGSAERKKVLSEANLTPAALIEVLSLLGAHDREKNSGELRPGQASSETLTPSTVLPGQIGKYTILRKIGSGGMADVFLAKTNGPGGFVKEFALKCLRVSMTDSTTARQLFEYEAKLSSRLSHGNIVGVYEFFHYEDNYLLVMEYVRGKTLFEWRTECARKGIRIPYAHSLFIVAEALKALDYAHTKKDSGSGEPMKIVHRDISPNNIMVTYEGAVKLLDFGIAKAWDRQKLTRTGSLRGTAQYIAPERWRGDDADHRSDLFSVGVVLYELLSGAEAPTTASDSPLGTSKAATVSLDSPGLPPELRQIIRKSLTWEPGDRFQSAREFLSAIHAAPDFSHELTLPNEIAEQLGASLSTTVVEDSEFLNARTRNQESVINAAEDSPAFALELPDIQNNEKEFRRSSDVSSEPVATTSGRGKAFLTGMLVVGFLVALAIAAFEYRSGGSLRTLSSTGHAQDCVLNVTSTPSEARVFINGMSLGDHTPSKIGLTCGEGVELSVEANGYRLQYQYLYPSAASIPVHLTLVPGESGWPETIARGYVRFRHKANRLKNMIFR